MNGKLIIETSKYQTIEYDLKNCLSSEGVPLSINGERVSNGFQLFAQLSSKRFNTNEQIKQEIEKQDKVNELREEREKITKAISALANLNLNYLHFNSCASLRTRIIEIDEQLFELEGCYKITKEEWAQIKEDYREYLIKKTKYYHQPEDVINDFVAFCYNSIHNFAAAHYCYANKISLKETDKFRMTLVCVPKLFDLETIGRCGEMVRPIARGFEYKHIAE